MPGEGAIAETREHNPNKSAWFVVVLKEGGMYAVICIEYIQGKPLPVATPIYPYDDQ